MFRDPQAFRGSGTGSRAGLGILAALPPGCRAAHMHHRCRTSSTTEVALHTE
ncbi:hypothetical protein ACFOEY_15630 [Paracandidimonas soli]|uniref:hypothetical protein n=1 Tax=Paracandidimonas soli TaxID=1917182 RepID=UPI00360BA43F